ncbi:MAG: hypothetical protein GQ564_01290 [Bacteroidales bacterium]|nr:hypothetical protein [Bacteroidales bacterium]
MNLKKFIYLLSFILFISCESELKNKEIIRLGNFQNRPRGFHSVYMPQGRIALYIKNDLNKKTTIQNIRYFIGDKGNYKKPFKVMLYSIDSITGKPSKILIPDTLIISAKSGNYWTTIDISAYSLDFPKEGVFASMEWIPDEDFSVVSQSECQYLAYNKVKNENKTWYCTLGVNWYQFPNNNYNTMISIDVK